LKILILKPSSLGDVIHALPVLRLLKLHFHDAEIFWWIDSALAPLIEGDRDLTGIVRFERKRWGKPRHWPEMLRSIRGLREQNFDLVIDLQGLARSAIFAWLARGKFLIGLDDTREGASAFYDVAVPRKSFHTHAVDWYLSVLPALGVPVHKHFEWLPERPEISAAVKSKWPTDGARWVALLPGARWINKRWPAEHFSELVRTLSKSHPDVRFAVLGGKDDQALGETISQSEPARVVNLCGATSLLEMIEFLRRCDLLVTNDSGPMHVAAALGRPLLALFGPTAPERTGPYGQLDHVLRLTLPCSPCLKSECHYEKPLECLRALPPAVVAQRAAAILS